MINMKYIFYYLLWKKYIVCYSRKDLKLVICDFEQCGRPDCGTIFFLSTIQMNDAAIKGRKKKKSPTDLSS